jgi:hypothetical protein
MMKRVFANTFISFVLLLAFQSGVEAERHGSPGDDRLPRLFYSFSLRVPEQRDYACALQKIVRSCAHRLQVVGVVRDGAELEAFRRRHDLSYPLRHLSEALKDPELPVEIRAWLERAENRFLLQDRDGRTVGTGAGTEPEQLLAVLGLVPTDVDESTWGKIKELFQ